MRKILLATLTLGLLVGSAAAAVKNPPRKSNSAQKTQEKTQKGLVPPEGQPAKGAQKAKTQKATSTPEGTKAQKVPPVKN